MRDQHDWGALSPIPLSRLALTFVARQKQKEEEAPWAVHPSSKRPTMSLVTHSTVPAIPNRPTLRQPNRFVRLVCTIIEARTRMYLAAVTDPATGRINPVLEQRVLRMMAL